MRADLAQHKIAIRTMQPSDAARIAQLHVDAFPGFFLSLLGPSFLRQFYLGLSTDRYGVALVAESGTDILGFVAGSLKPTGSYRRLLRSRLMGFAFHAALAILRKPKIAARLVRSVAGRTSGEVAAGTAELMSIAVDPHAQGRSVGHLLIAAFLEQAARAEAKQVRLTTDSLNNAPVNRFYLRQGFRLSRSFLTPEGRSMNEYEIRLDSSVLTAASCVDT